jgi:hypothetical protein
MHRIINARVSDTTLLDQFKKHFDWHPIILLGMEKSIRLQIEDIRQNLITVINTKLYLLSTNHAGTVTDGILLNTIKSIFLAEKRFYIRLYRILKNSWISDHYTIYTLVKSRIDFLDSILDSTWADGSFIDIAKQFSIYITDSETYPTIKDFIISYTVILQSQEFTTLYEHTSPELLVAWFQMIQEQYRIRALITFLPLLPRPMMVKIIRLLPSDEVASIVASINSHIDAENLG